LLDIKTCRRDAGATKPLHYSCLKFFEVENALRLVLRGAGLCPSSAMAIIRVTVLELITINNSRNHDHSGTNRKCGFTGAS
jgi:hypothetical protein